MARSFASTDLLTGPSIAQPSTGATFLAWIKAPNVSSARLFTIGNSGGTFKIDFSTATTIRLVRVYATTNGSWTCTSANHGMTLSDWNHVAWTHDGTSAAPLFYANGVSKTVTTGTSPSGAITLTAGNVYVGNINSGGSPFGSGLAHIALVPRVLTAGEIRLHMLTGFIDGATLLYPIWNDTPEPDISGNKNNIVTTTGTALVSNPPTMPRLSPIHRARSYYSAVMYTESGSAVVIASASGLAVCTFVDSILGRAICIGSAVDAEQFLDSGLGRFIGASSGLDLNVLSGAGSGVSVLRSSGIDRLVFNEIGASTVISRASGIDVIFGIDTGKGIAIGVASGVTTLIVTNTGTGILVTIGSGVDAIATAGVTFVLVMPTKVVLIGDGVSTVTINDA